MKNRLSYYALLALTASPAFAMQQENALSASTPLYTKELRYLISQFLFEQATLKDALKSLVAFSSTDTQAYAFFSEDVNVTSSFVKWLYELSYTNASYVPFLERCCFKADQALVSKPISFLNKQGLTAFSTNTEQCKKLVKLFEQCRDEKSWDPVINKLKEIENTPLNEYIRTFYWECSFNNSPAKKNLLVYALELDAPTEVIEALLERNFALTGLCSTTPPPCLMVCKNLLAYNKEYLQKRSQADADWNLIEKEVGTHLSRLQGLIKLLIEKGACIDDFFYVTKPTDFCDQHITPLFLVIEAGDAQIMEFLFEQKLGELGMGIELKALTMLKHRQISAAMFKRLIESTNKPQNFFRQLVFSASTVFSISTVNSDSIKEYVMGFVPFFLERGVDINTDFQGMTVLDRAKTVENNDKVISMLIAQGAVEKSSQPAKGLDGNKLLLDFSLRFQNIHQGASQLSQGKMTDDQREEVKEILNDARKLLLNPQLENKDHCIMSFLMIALEHVSEFEEAKQLLLHIATNEQISVNMGRRAGTISSVFLYLVEMLNACKDHMPEEMYMKTKNNAFVAISFLAKAGGKDTSFLMSGKTALKAAEELGMDECAQHIADALKEAAL